MFSIVDGIPRVAALPRDNFRIRLVAVVRYTVSNEVVVEEVEVRMYEAVVRDLNLVGTDPERGDLVGTRIVDCLLGLGVASKGYGDAIPDERGGLLSLLRRDEIQRSNLVVLTPPAPVRQFLLPLLYDLVCLPRGCDYRSRGPGEDILIPRWR